ncbi:MAG TPA: exosortase/archaeosortase family protein [Patescibacteria group bacterium]|nr:exosortase/archaeosortase family protein [Patescibacteria group bacterium]
MEKEIKTDQKAPFKMAFLGLVILLTILPFVTTFNSALTELFLKMGWYRWIQETVAPIEARLVAVMILPFGIKTVITPGYEFTFALLKGNEYLPVLLSWNCLGWQSLLLLGLTFLTGLQGNYTVISKLKCIAIGLMGTMFVNLFRMSLITLLIYYVNRVAAVIIHDYVAALFAVLWLLFFWWFSYSFVLESGSKEA